MINLRTQQSALFSFLLILAAWLPLGSAQGQDAPFTGVVTERSVEIRSGAGLAFYTVGELKRNQVVQVEEVLFNNTWYKIRVPEGIYSYISKAFVDAQGDGTTGVINSNETEVLAASLRGPGVSYRVQRTMDRGTKVKIVAEEGNYYKVVPPTDAYVFIKAGTLRQATAADMVPAKEEDSTNDTTESSNESTETEPEATDGQGSNDTTPAEGNNDITEEAMPEQGTGETDSGESDTDASQTTPQGQGDSDTTMPDQATGETEGSTESDAGSEESGDAQTAEGSPAKVDGDGDAEAQADKPLPPAPDVEVSTPARSDALKQVELAMLPYFTLPLEDRPLNAIEQKYREVQSQNELGRVDSQIVEIRLRAIERQRAALTTILASRKAREERKPAVAVPTREEVPETPKDYSAVGTLTISTQYNGVDLPQLYRIAAPSGRTIAYVEPSDAIDSAVMLGKIVGVVGPSRYDPALKLHIISVQDADVLTTQRQRGE